MKKKISLVILSLILLLITVIATTQAIFSYVKYGETANVITTGSLNFIYTENSGVGPGINLTDAEPVSDEIGKAYATENRVFDFKVEGTNTSNSEVNYEITLAKDSTSTLVESAVKIYLVEMNGSSEVQLLAPTLYNKLVQTSKSGDTEKTLYVGSVPASTNNYSKSFRLKMWVDENLDFASGNYDNKTFITTVNVYADVLLVESATKRLLVDEIMENQIVEAVPTLTDSSNNTSDPSGLYKSIATNDGSPTYYFRGNVQNNYIDFAGFTWRVVRINEDGTIRIVMQDGINDNAGYSFNSNYNNKDHMYYTNSEAKTTLETWYQENIVDKGYSDKVATPNNYFCEQAKVVPNSTYATNSGADMVLYSDYTPNFMCSNDTNNRGLVNTSIGLLNYDEVLYAGGYYKKSNNSYYLYNSAINWWSMSPAGFPAFNNALVWHGYNSDDISHTGVESTGTAVSSALRPVINLRADTTVTGEGTAASHWVVQ